MSDQLTDREAELMRKRGWELLGDLGWNQANGAAIQASEGSPWWEEDLAEVRDELRERSPYQQGFWDAEHSRTKNPFERGSKEWGEYERGLDDYYSAVSEMNEGIDDYYNDNYEEVDE